MDFNLTEDQKLIRDMVREFAEKELAELAAELDDKREFPKIALKKMGELGLLGLAVPEKYSGGEMDISSVLIAAEELGKACASSAVIFAAHNLVVSRAIAQFGTDAQRNKYLPQLAMGKIIAGISLMEPDCEDEIVDMQLVAARDGDSFMLNGTKRMLLGGANVSLFLILAKDGGNAIHAFIIEKGAVGFNLGDDEDTLGLRATKCAIATFGNCRIPANALLGDSSAQFDCFHEMREIGKLAISAIGIGIAQTALKLSVEHSWQRRQFDKFIGEFDGLRWMMAQMECDIASARNNLYCAAALKHEGKPATKECAIAKLTASQLAVKATTDAIQIRGGYGYMREYPLERMFRDAKAIEFMLGTPQTQKKIIAEKVMGK